MVSNGQLSLRNVLAKVVTIGLDLGKASVHFVGLHAGGHVRTRDRYSKG